MRTGGTRKRGFFAGLGRSCSSVTATGVTYFAFPPRAEVAFSGALQAGSLAVGSWSVRRANQGWTVSAVASDGTKVTVSQGGVHAESGPDEVVYDGVAGDLRDAAGDEIGAFVV